MAYDSEKLQVITGSEEAMAEGHYARRGVADLADLVQKSRLLRVDIDRDAIRSASEERMRAQPQLDAEHTRNLVNRVMEYNSN